MYELDNKVALVTGGASGIGAAIVKEFLKERVKFVAILDINEINGIALEEELTNKYGQGRVKFVKCDVTKDDQLHSAYEQTISMYLYIDIVVNNAGIATDAIPAYKKTIEINLTALVSSSLKALDLMSCAKGGKGGTIINVSSAAALALSSPSLFIYAATKAAVLHFTCCIGKDAYYTKTKVRTICMCYGLTDTEIIENFGSFDEDIMNNFSAVGPKQSVEEAAQGTVKAYKTGKSGSVWSVWCKMEEMTDTVNKAYEIMSSDVFPKK